MSVERSVSVFYGTWVDKKSEAGKKLSAIIDEQSGTPADTPVRGVALGLVGSHWSGDLQITIHLRKSWLDSGALDGSLPRRIGEMPSATDAEPIREFLRSMGIDEEQMQPIGWHFAMCVF